jgi:hypothetical protein
MGDIKVENADVNSSHPLVLDVMGDPTSKEPVATHVLTFGDFVIVGALDNLKIVSFEEWTQRQADAAAAAKEAEAAAVAEQHASPLSSDATDYAEPATAKLKRRDLEEMTKDDLQGIADDHDIEIPSHATKAEMVDLIVKGQ